MNQTFSLFEHPEFGSVRSVLLDNNSYFVGKDVATCLGYKNQRDAVNSICKKFLYVPLETSSTGKKIINFANISNTQIESIHVNQQVRLIDEADLFNLINKTEKISETKKQEFIKFFQESGHLKNITFYSRKEINFLDDLTEFLKVFNIEIEHQVLCGNYRIDFVIKELAIEYDENDHKYYSVEEEKKRSDFILNEGYKQIIRLSDKNSNAFNIALVVKSLIKFCYSPFSESNTTENQ